MRQHVGGIHALRARHMLLLVVVKIVISLCRWNHHRVLFLLVWGVSTEVKWFIFGEPFFFSLSSPSNSKLVLFVFYFLASVLFLFISIFFLSPFVKILFFSI
jgi:hypothetical protein